MVSSQNPNQNMRESFNKSTKQKSNIAFVFCLKGTENALKTLFDHWCSGLWRVTEGKSLKHIPRWTTMDWVVMLSQWRKNCLDQFLTCPSAIIQSVIQPEAWRWRQNVDPNASNWVYVNVLFSESVISWIIHPPNLLKFGQIFFLEESVVCKSNFKFLQALRFFIVSGIFIAAKYFDTHIQVHPLNQMSLYEVISVVNTWVYL